MTMLLKPPAANGAAAAASHDPAWDPIDARPIPDWFPAAKLGIFLHWGVYSVPAWAPRRRDVATDGAAYAEAYGWAMRRPGSPTAAFHRRVYGGAPYTDFAPRFRAELFDADDWADLFVRSGAKYVVLTAKHHDGYCLFPSSYSPDWNSMAVGPGRDLVGELGEAVRKRGLKFGVYYSLLEWHHPLYKHDLGAYVDQHMLPQMRELVQRCRPDLLWTDGEWDHGPQGWRSTEFLAWLFTESAVASDIVVYDRWGKGTRSVHGGVFTSEYGQIDDHGTPARTDRAWEECRSIGGSFGYNRNERLEDYLTGDQLSTELQRVNDSGGNLLLNVGPRADGTICPLMAERLIQLGHYVCERLEAGRSGR